MNLSQTLRTGLVGSLATLALVACTASEGTGPGTTERMQSAAPGGSVAGAPSGPASAGAPAGIPVVVWNGVLADLAERTSDGVVEPTVLSARAMTWNDGAWGCPEEGVMYTQALVEGFQVVVEVGGEEFDYRSDGQSVRFCDSSSVLEGGG